MAYDENDSESDVDSPEEKIDNDEISPEEEGFMMGYDEGADNESDYDMNSDEE